MENFEGEFMGYNVHFVWDSKFCANPQIKYLYYVGNFYGIYFVYNRKFQMCQPINFMGNCLSSSLYSGSKRVELLDWNVAYRMWNMKYEI